jgi:BirA family biotin operon repressor/biotin-[acetyl-CoA-carboxylase] ligase
MCAIFTGNTIIKLDTVDSTNNYLTDLTSKQKLNDGTVVVTKYQTAGKGQRGNVWIADANQNLTFSIIYFPKNMRLSEQFVLTQAISLGVYDYLNSIGIKAKIKWPNDIYVSNHKIGGILIENTIKGETIVQTIIGIGLNVNQQKFNLPNNKVTSLSRESQKLFDINEEVYSLLTYIERRYMQWLNGLFKLLKHDYLEVLYLYQSWHIYHTSEGKYLDGKIIGTNDIGQLLIQDLNDQVHLFGNKEIIF